MKNERRHCHHRCPPFPGVHVKSFFARTWILPFLEEMSEMSILSPGIQLPDHRATTVYPEHPNRVRHDLFEAFSHHSSNKGKSGSIYAGRLLECQVGE